MSPAAASRLMATLLLLSCSVATGRHDAVAGSFGPSQNRSLVTWPLREQTVEQRLLYRLLYGYERRVRPVRNASFPVHVRVGITLTHIFDLDERNQVLTTMVWLDQEWEDELLAWNPAEYNGLTALHVPCELLWLPDIVLYNSADDYTIGYMKSRAKILSNGTVFWPPPTKLRSTCSVNIKYFPFDTQECFMKFGSWVYDADQLNTTNRTAEVDLKNYVKNGEWQLLRVEVTRNKVIYDTCCPEYFWDVTYKIIIRRRVLYYAYKVLFPCITMSALTLLVFVLPPDGGEKVALGVSVLLAFTVFMLAVAEKLPETSDHVPLIGIYLTVVMTMASISVIMTVLVSNVDWRSPEKYLVSDWIKHWILGKVAHLMGIETDFNVRHQKKSALALRRSCKTEVARHGPRLGQENRRTGASTGRDASGKTAGTPQPFRPYKASTSPASPIRSLSPNQNPRANHDGQASATLVNGMPRPPERHSTGENSSQLQQELIKLLSLRVSRQEEDDCLKEIRKQWRQVAMVLDRCLFWLFFAATLLSTFVLLVIMPFFGDSGIRDPVEDHFTK